MLEPHKNSLSISLIDPVVFLRGVDFSDRRSTVHENAPPSILRGLLTLCLTKPTRISSIQVELIGESVTVWSEGPALRPKEMRDENKLFSAVQTFFQAPQTPTSRRAFSAPPEAEFINRRHASPPSPVHSPGSAHFLNLFDPPRDRERAHADEAILQRTHPQEVHLHTPTARDSQSHASFQEDASMLPAHSLRDGPHIQAWAAPPRTSLPPPGRGSQVIVLGGDEHKDAGDGWQVFTKGLYTFPISFAIPSYMPPTISCDYGSVAWRLKASVHRPGVFTPKLSASHEVILVASPNEDLREDTEGFVTERVWEDQLQYTVSVSGRMFPIGGTLPITLSFLPMAKVKIYRISALLEEQIIFFTSEPMIRHIDARRRFNLLSLESKDKDSPILPLSQTMTDSPLRDMPPELAANLMGAGPWTLQMALKVPNGSGTLQLHFSNNNRRAPIEIFHTLTIVIRVERGDDIQMDPMTGQRKRFDVILQTPIHILSSLATAQHVALPRYTERQDVPSPPPAPRVSGGSRRYTLPLLRHTFAPQSLITAGPLEPFVLTEEPSGEVDTLYERSAIFERLITGQQNEAGVVPPAYSAMR